MAPGPQRGTVSELRELLSTRQLPPYRDVDGNEVPWASSPGDSNASLKRFLVGRKGDVRKAADMLEAHAHWRRRVFPIRRQGLLPQLLDDGKRYYRLGTCTDGVPILVIDFLWGHFLTEEATPLLCLRAAIRFMEEEIAKVDEEDRVVQARVLAFGGPPPIGFASALGAVLEANYPERLLTAVIYPVPRMIRRIVFAMLWFLDETTRSKVSVECEESTMLELMHYPKHELPCAMQGGIDGVYERFKPDSARMNRLIREGLLQNRGEAGRLQLQLVEEATKDARRGQGALAGNGHHQADSAAGNSPDAFCGMFADWQNWFDFSCCVARDNRGDSGRGAAGGGKLQRGPVRSSDAAGDMWPDSMSSKPGRQEAAPSGTSCGTLLLTSIAIGVALIALFPLVSDRCLEELM